MLVQKVKKDDKFRTIGFYQPFGSLMLHGKIETRWILEDRVPPFPLGKYLFYTTQSPIYKPTLIEWCGDEILSKIDKVLENEPTKNLGGAGVGYAIAIGELTKIRLLKKEEADLAFVKFVGTQNQLNTTTAKYQIKDQWALHFENVQRIEPFVWKFGKQGIGFVPESELSKIKIIE